MSGPLPLAVVGGGSIGLRHVEVAQASDRVRLTGVVEPDADRRRALADSGLPAVAALGDLPGETRAAVIATPTPDHAGSARDALDRGWAVLVEKPVTATLAEADALIEAADRAGLPLRTGHHRRCHPFVAEARALLPRIGALVAVQGLWSLRKHDSYYDVAWRRAPGAGPILTNLSHEIDLLRFFCGEVAEVSALVSAASRGLDIEDTAALAFRFETGALGTFLISDAGLSPWAFEAASGENPAIAPSGQDALRFIGTEGALSFPSLDLWTGARDWSEPLVRSAGPVLPKVDPLAVQIERFAAVAEGAEDDLLATGRDGRATLAATLATLDAAATGGTARPLPDRAGALR